MNKKSVRMMGRCGVIVEVPCNWNVKGRCGEDSKPCRLEEITTSNKK
jgi:hypothetical protein